MWGNIVSLGFLALGLAIILLDWVSVVSGDNFSFIFNFGIKSHNFKNYCVKFKFFIRNKWEWFLWLTVLT